MSTPPNPPQPGAPGPSGTGPQPGPSGTGPQPGPQPAASTPPYAPNPQAQPPQAVNPPYGAPPTPRVRNNVGTVSLIAGIAAIATNFISVTNQAFQYASAVADMSRLSTIQLTATIFMVVHGLLAVAAIVFGVIGLATKGRPKATAGIGLGIGVTAVCATISSLLYSGLINTLLGH